MFSIINKTIQKTIDGASIMTGAAAGGAAGFIFQASTASFLTKALVTIGATAFPVVSVPVGFGAVGVGAASAGTIYVKNKLVKANQKKREEALAEGFCDYPKSSKKKGGGHG